MIEKLKILKKYIEEIKLINSEKINKKGSFLKSEVYTCYLNNGKIITREKLIKGNHDGSAVIIVPITTNDEILTVVEPRVFTKEGILVGFPAGYIEEGELPVDAAKRELLEETGYTSDEFVYLDSFYQDEGVSSALNHIFLALDCEKKYDQELDKDEIVKYMTFNYDELFELEKMGYISGCNTKLALEKSKVYMKGR